jgi:crotonobetainyl-CoA:carnitine CoA-transferase CaiB-like acyl-CoA transferase
MTADRHGAPLAGIRVLSLAEQLPGPMCTYLLAELGADVILLERPRTGDPLREFGPWVFNFAGRNKRSICLDLKNPSALEAALALAARVDVVVEGYRPGVIDRLGLGYETVSSRNPAVVYCSISGYGQDGPYRDVSGHNVNYEAVAGVLSPLLYGRGEPSLDTPPWGDVVAGSLAALSITAEVGIARSTGQGRFIDISITDSLVFALGPVITRQLNGAVGWHAREPAYGCFRCVDGYLALGISHEDHFWASLCDRLALGEYRNLTHQERIADRAQIRPLLEEALATRTVAEWLDALGPDVPCSPVNTLEQLRHDPQLEHRRVIEDAVGPTGTAFATVTSPVADRHGAERVPRLGESTADVLRDYGVAEDVIRVLARAAEGS